MSFKENWICLDSSYIKEAIRDERFYYLKSLSESDAKLKIILEEEKNKDNKIIITFNDVEAYRNTNESFRLKGLDETIEGFSGKGWLFKTSDSAYIRWLREQASGVCDDEEFIHYCIVDSDTITDVIAYSDPVIEYVNGTDSNK